MPKKPNRLRWWGQGELVQRLVVVGRRGWRGGGEDGVGGPTRLGGRTPLTHLRLGNFQLSGQSRRPFGERRATVRFSLSGEVRGSALSSLLFYACVRKVCVVLWVNTVLANTVQTRGQAEEG